MKKRHLAVHLWNNIKEQEIGGSHKNMSSHFCTSAKSLSQQRSLFKVTLPCCPLLEKRGKKIVMGVSSVTVRIKFNKVIIYYMKTFIFVSILQVI